MCLGLSLVRSVCLYTGPVYLSVYLIVCRSVPVFSCLSIHLGFLLLSFPRVFCRDFLLEVLCSSPPRVRFACAAYLPVSKSDLSQSSLQRVEPSLANHWNARGRRGGGEEEEAQERGRRREGGGRGGRSRSCSLSGVSSARATSAFPLCPSLSYIRRRREDSLPSLDRLWRSSIPASRWIHRAIRAATRISLQEGNLRLVQRPQGPLSLCDALICQWKLQLERYLSPSSSSSSRFASLCPLHDHLSTDQADTPNCCTPHIRMHALSSSYGCLFPSPPLLGTQRQIFPPPP